MHAIKLLVPAPQTRNKYIGEKDCAYLATTVKYLRGVIRMSVAVYDGELRDVLFSEKIDKRYEDSLV